jgi:acyl-CoA thioester hydrolase
VFWHDATMSRIDVDLPERVLFTTEIPIRVGDINYGGHLGNDAVLSIAQEARARFYASHGFSELECDGASTAMVNAALIYGAEGKYGMVLRVEIGAADVRSREFDLLYRMVEAASGKEVARVKTGIVSIDLTTRRIVRLPERLRRALAPA